MKSWKKPTDNLVQKALDSVKTEVDRRYFFSKLKNPHWIRPLEAHGVFNHPPEMKRLPDGYVQYPFWPEIQFLKNVANEAVEQVLEIILRIPKTCNPRIYNDVIDIALNIEAPFSTRLKEVILEYVQGDYPFLYPRFERVLCYWASNGQTESALELAEALIAFQLGPQRRDKIKRRSANPEDWTTSPEPPPGYDEWKYKQILEKGVRPLAELEPYPTARILIDAVATMIRLRRHQDELERAGGNDYSAIWCPRVNEPSNGYRDSRVDLVQTLTFACEKVYEEAPESVAALDQELQNQRWDIFIRIRQHLYALHPNEQTKPWIHECILGHEDYAKREHHFEFQRMIRLACEKLGADLLTTDERKQIFETILSWPSEREYRDWMRDQFSEQDFNAQRRRFHLAQLSPFAPVLFGKYADYFQELKGEEEKPITDDDYPPHKIEVQSMEERSPKRDEELVKMPDEELLSFLNEWENVDCDYMKGVHINFRALAQAFQSIFKEVILSDESRLCFWMKNRERVERPIYVRAMVSAIHEQIESKQFDKLDEWFDLCEWVLSHSDLPMEEGVNRSDVSKEHPDWRSSRRAVGDFVEKCLKKDVNVPITAREHLASLLDKLCTQCDRRLDDDEPVFPGRDSQLDEAINNTRSRALKDLVDFGYWVRRRGEDDQADTPEVFTILEKRLGSEYERQLTLPEYAILGMHYVRICDLDWEWATQHRSGFFPQEDLRAWTEAFGNFLKFSRPFRPIFKIIRDDIEFALGNIDEFKVGRGGRTNLTDRLGEHLFTYYLWGVCPLMGGNGLLERFYEETKADQERWSRLFDYIGRTLKNSGKQLQEGFEQRIVEFFEWRYEKKEQSELRQFTFWLTAECLDAEWRLMSYSRVLDLCGSTDYGISIQMDALREMLEDHTALVVECFAKLSQIIVKDRIVFIQTDEAKPIIRAGLDSDDATVQANAERARENLLQCGHFSLLDEED